MRCAVLIIGTAMLLVSCGGDAAGPTAAEVNAPVNASESDAVTASGRPLEMSFVDYVYDAFDPCRGTGPHTLKVESACRLRLETGAQVVTCKRVTTLLDYVGHGTMREVYNGHVLNFKFTDILTNDSGARAKAQAQLVLDLSTGTSRVDRFSFICLKP